MKKPVAESSGPMVPLKVLFVASECAPFVKCGGLGDVMASLPKALRKLGVDARVVVPLYSGIDRWKSALHMEESCGVHMGGGEEHWCSIHVTAADGGVPVWFVEYDRYFGRSGVYGEGNEEYADNAYRFGFLCRAAMQLCEDRNWIPDVFHLHDWPTAIAALLLKRWAAAPDAPLSGTASVLSVHNGCYQGYFDRAVLPYLGLGDDVFTPDGLESYGKINLLKGGLVFADALTTVSPMYAREVQSEPGGCGLSAYYRARPDFVGILNGADYEIWNPEMDPFIPATFRESSLMGKGICKKELQKEMGLAEDASLPVFGMICRLTGQKGIPLVREALPRALDSMSMQFVCLGSGDPNDEAFFQWLATQYPGRVGIKIGYDNILAHRIEAGADFFLMPSLFEPCGLNQMYSLRYGTLPIVHATGGLEDTVVQYNEGEGVGTGFKFYHADGQALYDTIGWAVSTWWDRPTHITVMREAAMRERFDWATSARQYLDVYQNAIHRHRAGMGN